MIEFVKFILCQIAELNEDCATTMTFVSYQGNNANRICHYFMFGDS